MTIVDKYVGILRITYVSSLNNNGSPNSKFNVNICLKFRFNYLRSNDFNVDIHTSSCKLDVAKGLHFIASSSIMSTFTGLLQVYQHTAAEDAQNERRSEEHEDLCCEVALRVDIEHENIKNGAWEDTSSDCNKSSSYLEIYSLYSQEEVNSLVPNEDIDKCEALETCCSFPELRGFVECEEQEYQCIDEWNHPGKDQIRFSLAQKNKILANL